MHGEAFDLYLLASGRTKLLYLSLVSTGITFLGYAVIGVLAFVSALVTETKGRSLEEIEADLQRKATFASG